MGADCLQESNGVGDDDSSRRGRAKVQRFEGIRRTAWRAGPGKAGMQKAHMAGRSGKNRADLTNHYSISVPSVNDYFKWFGWCGIGLRSSG